MKELKKTTLKMVGGNMKSNKWIFIFLLVFLGIIFFGWEFFVTSRMTLDVRVIYPEYTSDDVGFAMKLYSEGFENEEIVYSQDKNMEYKSLPFGDYFFEISLDDRLIIKQFHSFQSRFSINRLKESVTLDISDLASITSVNYKIVDPYLTVKWIGKYLGGYKPAEYKIRVNESEKKLSVNYIEVDVLKELLAGRDSIKMTIIPLNRNGGELLSFDYDIPIRLESVTLDIPNGFNVYDMSINIQEKRIPINPYDSKISFPVIDLSENKIPFEIYYYEDRLWKSELNFSEAKETIQVPEIPRATVTKVELYDSTATVYLDVVREEEFLYNRFSHFEIFSDTFYATTSKAFTYNGNHDSVNIIPFFDPDIKGESLIFAIPSPPKPQLHITLYDNLMKFKPRVKIFSDSTLTLSGTMTIDNYNITPIPAFKNEILFEPDFKMDEVHLVEVELKDSYGQIAQISKWVSTAVPETTFFTQCELNKDQTLVVAWDQLSVYSEAELIITDNYNIKRFYPVDSSLKTDLSGTLLREPLKIILKGYLDNEVYTAAVIEDIWSKEN